MIYVSSGATNVLCLRLLRHYCGSNTRLPAHPTLTNERMCRILMLEQFTNQAVEKLWREGKPEEPKAASMIKQITYFDVICSHVKRCR